MEDFSENYLLINNELSMMVQKPLTRVHIYLKNILLYYIVRLALPNTQKEDNELTLLQLKHKKLMLLDKTFLIIYTKLEMPSTI